MGVETAVRMAAEAVTEEAMKEAAMAEAMAKAVKAVETVVMAGFL